MDERKTVFEPAAWRYFTGFFRGQTPRVALSSLGAAVQSLLVLPMLFLVRYLFDVAIPRNDIGLIVWAGAGIFGFRVINSAVALWLRAMNITIINTVVFKLREDLLQRLYGFSRRFHTETDQKILHTRIVQDSERLATMSNTLLSRMFPALLTSVSLGLVLCCLNWVLVLVMAALFPVVFLANRHTMNVVRSRTYVFQRAFESFSKGIWFVLRYMDLTRVQAAEGRELARQTATMQELREQTGRMSFSYAVHAQVQQTLTGLSGILILVIGGASLVHSRMTIGEFLSFYVAAMFLYGQVDIITASLTDLVSGNESLATLHRLAATRDPQPYSGTRLIDFQGAIRLEGVSFAYGRQPVLAGATLDIRPGNRLAIIGANGAGKSTAIELILGFYAPQQGRLLADGIPYGEIDLAGLRRSIGVVLQNPPLFAGTILENLTYGVPEAGREQVSLACETALAGDFIRRLPAGLDTGIGDDGVLLSGGERQRLAIARALLRRPRLLILDEPTNHLDHDTVARLMDRLDHLEERPAILLVSHDRGVVAHAPEVYELAQGTFRPVHPPV